jgi:hypothetical protein
MLLDRPQRSLEARSRCPGSTRRIQVPKENEEQPPNEALPKNRKQLLRNKQKKALSENESNRNEYDRALGTFKGQISRFRQEQQMIMTYNADGWKGASKEKLKPHGELTKARETIARCLKVMRECVKICDEAGGDLAIPPESFDEEGEIDANNIFCGRCRTNDSTDDNDIIMCDGMCDRAYHMKCVFPPLDASILEDDAEEGWLCPACDRKIDMIDEINDEFGTEYEYEDTWETILSPNTLPTEHDLYDFRTAEECLNGGQKSSWLDALELPSEGDESDEDFEVKSDIDCDPEEENGVEGDELLSSCSSLEEGTDDSSGCCSEYLDGAIEDVDIGSLTPIKNRIKFEEVDRREMYKLLENEEPEILKGKRKRVPVDYKALNVELFGDMESPDLKINGHVSESDDDAVWSPTKNKKRS